MPLSGLRGLATTIQIETSSVEGASGEPALSSSGSVEVDTLGSTETSLSVTSVAQSMTADDFIVVVATTIMLFACIVGVYLFKNGRKIEYGEDERLLSDDRLRSPRRSPSRSSREDEGSGKKKKKKISRDTSSGADSVAKTKELKRKMKKKSSGKMLTVPEESPYQEGDGVTLEDIEVATGSRGIKIVRDKSSDSNSDSHSSSLASSLHDDVLKRTLVSVLGGAGLTIMQHRENADPKPIILSLEGDELQWKSKKVFARNAYTMNLRDVDTIEWGKHSMSFSRSTALAIPDELCCSLVARDSSLDLQCSTKTERDTLLHGISLMVGDIRAADV